MLDKNQVDLCLCVVRTFDGDVVHPGFGLERPDRLPVEEQPGDVDPTRVHDPCERLNLKPNPYAVMVSHTCDLLNYCDFVDDCANHFLIV